MTLVFRRDRYGQGGDHIPFNERGYAAVRITEPNENFDRQHKKVEMVNGVEFGDVVDRVDFAYVAQVARVNAAALASLGAGTSTSDRRPLRHRQAGIRHPDWLEAGVSPTSPAIGSSGTHASTVLDARARCPRRQTHRQGRGDR